MATELIMKRVLRGLEPETSFDAEQLNGLAFGTAFKVTVTNPKRSARQHRLYWALVKKVFDNQDHYRTTKALHTAVKIKLGYVSHLKMHDGEVQIIPKSIAFDKMDQAEFNEFMTAFIRLIVTEIVPGTTDRDWTREVEEMIAA